MALTATIYENKASFERVSQLSVVVSGGIEAQIPTGGMKKQRSSLASFIAAMASGNSAAWPRGLMAALNRWPNTLVLKSLPHRRRLLLHPRQWYKRHRPPAPVVPKSTIPSLSKVTLDKTRSSISLEKTAWQVRRNQGELELEPGQIRKLFQA